MEQTPNETDLAGDGRKFGMEKKADQNTSIKVGALQGEAIRMTGNNEIGRMTRMFADTSIGIDDLISRNTNSIIDNTANPSSRLLCLPLELQIGIIQYLDSSKDILSLQLTHTSFRQLLTGPYSTDIYSAIAFRRWAPKGGLALLDIICNGLANREPTNPLIARVGTCDIDCWKLRSWSLIPSIDDGSAESNIQLQFRMGLLELQQMEAIVQASIQPRLDYITSEFLQRSMCYCTHLEQSEPITIESPEDALNRIINMSYHNCRKFKEILPSEVSRVERAIYLILGSYKHYHSTQSGYQFLFRMPLNIRILDNDGKVLVDDSKDTDDSEEVWGTLNAYDAKGFMEEVDIASHLLMVETLFLLNQNRACGSYVQFHGDLIKALWFERKKMLKQRFNQQADTFGFFKSPDIPDINAFMEEISLDPTMDLHYDRTVKLLQRSNLPQYGWPVGENLDSASSRFRTVKGRKILEFVYARDPEGHQKSIARARLTEKKIYVPSSNQRDGSVFLWVDQATNEDSDDE